ncbi:MAG: 2'-5' RNA ligase family protein [Turicibacter sp.]|nr:2'-5' RNA ligase family protein [Turicibacter sp.]MBQ1786746.1 2'-5' RNA ligase family protein [Turicibacter sp.]MEE0881605.1 2'-5' RNA ligase family protein [Turicibacter sp.]MEE1237045.1 2'-5' RNA ligase family protein [Turicibacter sp.]
MEEKYYYLMALFDEKTNNYFHLLKSYIDLPANPSSIFLPHLTLGAYMKVDEDELCHWIEGQCKKLHQVVLNFNHLGLFALKVLFIAPQPSTELVQMHQLIHERYDNDYGEIGYNYTIQSNNWVPHVTLLMDDKEKILNALPILNEKFTPFKGNIVSLALYEYHTLREIKKYDLRLI